MKIKCIISLMDIQIIIDIYFESDNILMSKKEKFSIIKIVKLK